MVGKPSRTVGAKGQVVIPREIRERLGLREGSKVAFEQRGREVVLRPVETPEEFLARFFDTGGKKLRRKVDLKRVYEEQYEERARRAGL